MNTLEGDYRDIKSASLQPLTWTLEKWSLDTVRNHQWAPTKFQ